MRATCLIFLLLAVQVPAAEVFRKPNQGDGVEFSDREGHAAERVAVPPAQVYTPPRPAVRLSPQAPAQPEPDIPQRYSAIEIVEPANEATVRDNNGEFDVAVELSPSLQTRFAHRVELLLDGSPQGEPAGQTTFHLSGLNRGTHTLQARVLGADGAVLGSSPPTVFHLHRKIIPPRKPPSKK